MTRLPEGAILPNDDGSVTVPEPGYYRIEPGRGGGIRFALKVPDAVPSEQTLRAAARCATYWKGRSLAPDADERRKLDTAITVLEMEGYSGRFPGILVGMTCLRCGLTRTEHWYGLCMTRVAEIVADEARKSPNDLVRAFEARRVLLAEEVAKFAAKLPGATRERPIVVKVKAVGIPAGGYLVAEGDTHLITGPQGAAEVELIGRRGFVQVIADTGVEQAGLLLVLGDLIKACEPFAAMAEEIYSAEVSGKPFVMGLSRILPGEPGRLLDAMKAAKAATDLPTERGGA